MIFAEPASVLRAFSFLMIAVAILGYWASVSRFMLCVIMAAGVAFGLAAQTLTPLGLSFYAALAFALSRFYRRDISAPRPMLVLGLCVLGLALYSHQLPGFTTWVVAQKHRITDDSLAFAVVLDIDKPVAGFLFLMSGTSAIGSWAEWREMIRRTWHIIALCLFSLSVLGLALHYARIDFKFPEIAPFWLLRNLLFVCVAEEVFFRGFLQTYFIALFGDRYRCGKWLGVSLAAAIFGATHFLGGWAFVFLSSVAGLFYGWAYLRSNRIEAAILTHFALNTVHLLMFSYPALAPSDQG